MKDIADLSFNTLVSYFFDNEWRTPNRVFPLDTSAFCKRQENGFKGWRGVMDRLEQIEDDMNTQIEKELEIMRFRNVNYGWVTPAFDLKSGEDLLRVLRPSHLKLYHTNVSDVSS